MTGALTRSHGLMCSHHLVRIDPSLKDPAFAEKVDATIKQVKPHVLKVLRKHGVHVVAAEFLSDAVPWLKGKHLPGWPEGTTVDNSDALSADDKTVCIARKQIDEDTGMSKDNSRAATGTFHELGHAFVDAKGLWKRKTFIQPYERDKKRLSQDQRSDLSYYLQEGKNGMHETCAEMFAQLQGFGNRYYSDGSEPAELNEAFIKAFPSVKRVMAKLILRN